MTQIGLTYTVQHIRGGVVLSEEVTHNIVPTEGQNYLLAAGFDAATQITAWYMGIYENNYAPQYTDTMATFPGGGYSGESTAFDEAARQTVNFGTAAAGALASSANCVFTMNATKTIYGSFLSSSPTKSGTTGTLGSAVKFSAAKAVASGDLLSVSVSISLTGA